MASAPATLYSLGGIVEWIDNVITSALVDSIAGTIERITQAIWLPLEIGVTIYLLFYGYLIATQQIPTPFGAALWRIVKIILVVGLLETGGLYQTSITEAMLSLPDGLMSAATGQPTSALSALSDFHLSGLETATKLEDRAPSMLTQLGRAIIFSIVALFITLLYTIITVLGLVLSVVAKVGIALIVMVGPIFIAATLFDATKEYFLLWLRQALYFALYGLLFTMTFSLVMGMLAYVQSILLGMTDADAINIFQIMAVVIIVAIVSIFLFKLPSTILSGITGGHGVDLPFIGRI